MTGRVRRVDGPLVEVDGLPQVAVAEVVELGPDALRGEVVAIGDERVRVQAYEYTGGLAPGHPATALGVPLAADLGPWLLGGVFDGLLRPLADAPAWLAPGAGRTRARRRWRWAPQVSAGDEAPAGTPLGHVELGHDPRYVVLVPPGAGGAVAHVRGPGEVDEEQPVAEVGGRSVYLGCAWPVRRARPVRARLTAVAPLRTGQRVLDAVFPVVRGGSAAVPGGFGTGKTMLLQQVAKWCDADVIVYVGCGERGNEMADVLAELGELTDPRTGGRLADRTVIIANTSNMPVMAREASIFTGITVAEHFRDMGHDAVLIADSTSRWAEALRELGSRGGELPAEEGYPAHPASALAAFYERAGRVTTLAGDDASVTILGAVSPPGGDPTEPVTTLTQRFVRSVWSLDRDLAYSRHYPAVSWAGSFSLDVPAVAAWWEQQGDEEWGIRRGKITRLLAEADRLASVADLVGTAALPPTERIGLLAGRLVSEAFLQQNALEPNDAACSAEKSAALADATLAVVDACARLATTGTPADLLETHDFSPLLRARDACGPDDAEGVRQRRDAVLRGLGRLGGRP